jgi:hypothetical protein
MTSGIETQRREPKTMKQFDPGQQSCLLPAVVMMKHHHHFLVPRVMRGARHKPSGEADSVTRMEIEGLKVDLESPLGRNTTSRLRTL